MDMELMNSQNRNTIFDKEYFEDGTKSNYLGFSRDDVIIQCEIIANSISQILSPKRTLDIGCAKGFFVEALILQGIDAYGVDISEYAVSSAPASVSKKIYCLNIEEARLPFQNNYFDFISIMQTIEHLHRFDNLMKEMIRVIKPGGFVLVTTPSDNHSEKDITHVNVHPPPFWRNLFDVNDFIYDEAIRGNIILIFQEQCRRNRQQFMKQKTRTLEIRLEPTVTNYFDEHFNIHIIPSLAKLLNSRPLSDIIARVGSIKVFLDFERSFKGSNMYIFKKK